MMNKKPKRRKSGFTIAILFVLLMVGAGMLLTEGVFPQFNTSTPPNQDQEFIPITPDPQVSNQEKTSLQLETIRFKGCDKTVAIDFLLDRSGSMAGDKISKLKTGVLSFTSTLPDNSVIGMQDFSSPENVRSGTVKTLVPVSLYKDIKQQISPSVNSLEAQGWTYTRDAFAFTKDRLDEAVSKYPDYNFILIFVSDGVPETGTCSRTQQLSGSCVSEQNPNTAPSIPDQIKARGVRIFSIAYLDNNDTRWNNQLKTLMETAASSPEDFYIAPSTNQVDLILSQISTRLCNEPGAPTPTTAN